MIIIASYSNVSVTYTADGTQTVFSFPFDYLRKAFVYVETDGNLLEQGTDFSVYEKTVVFTTAPVADTVVKIYRSTDTTPLVSWADASVLRAKDMTIQQVQVLHILEEDQEWLQTNTINKENGKWNANGVAIGNVGDPENPDDAATKEYIDETYEYVKGKLDNLDITIEEVNEAKEDAEDAAERAEEALDLIKEKASWFDNVATMKTAEGLQIGMVAGTKGYYTPNDGGQSLYIIREKTVSDTENGGSIIFLDNGNVAELVAGDTVNIKQFGAKGNGVTDDTIAFSEAFIYAEGKTVIVPQGNYFINEHLFATDVKEVIDNGTYTEIKPVYPVHDLLLESDDLITIESSIAFDSGYTSTQGMCYNTKTKRLIVTEKQDGDASTTHTQKLLVVDPANDYNIDATYTYTELKHCNSMTYCPDDNKIYVESFIVDSGSASAFKVVVIDADTMSIVDTIDLTNLPYNVALSYDPLCKLFVLGGGNRLHLYDKNFTFLKTINVPDDGLTANGLLALDGQVVLFKIGSIEIFDLFGNLNKRIQSAGNMEAEDICWDGDETFYINYNVFAKIVLAKYNKKKISNTQSAKTKGEKIQKFTDVAASKINVNGMIYVDNSNLSNYGNLPIPKAFVYSFSTEGYIRQIAFGEDANRHKIFTREWGANGVNSWNDWQRVDGKQMVVESTQFRSNSFSANTYTGLTLDISKTGLTPIGVVGYNIATQNNLNATACYFNTANSKVELRVYNPGSATTANVVIYGLYLTN